MIRIREAAVAGSFYPADAAALREWIRCALDAARPAPSDPAPDPPVALVVPHAGYVYSGAVAAAAYSRLAPFADRIGRVLLLGPSHYASFPGLAASGADALRTPLGDVAVDREMLAALPPGLAAVNDAAHAPEHGLEVQLPFLQCVLGEFRVLPLLAGDADAEPAAAAIERLWLRPGCLVVVSSDLSHYRGYAEARRVDSETCQAIETLRDAAIGHDRACGATPLRGLLRAAARRGLRCETLDLRNSGDTAGGRGRVVGYGAWMFVEEASCERAA